MQKILLVEDDLSLSRGVSFRLKTSYPSLTNDSINSSLKLMIVLYLFAKTNIFLVIKL